MPNSLSIAKIDTKEVETVYTQVINGMALWCDSVDIYLTRFGNDFSDFLEGRGHGFPFDKCDHESEQIQHS